MRPNFLGVGASKSATSWVHTCMEEHPEIFVPSEKEIHFFNYNYEKGFDWYESFFHEGIGKKAIGEISGYLITPGVPQRIYDYNPDMRLLFFLRNPIDRAYSHYCMDLRSARVSEDIDQCYP